MKKLIYFATAAAMMAGCSKGDNELFDSASVIPVSLVGIEAVNIDNSGETPFISNTSIQKEAYMVGVRWLTDYVISENDRFITGPIAKGDQTYHSLSDKYSKAVKCNNAFNASIPAGTYVSKFFKEMDRDYLPMNVDEGFVLLVTPDPGEHSFRVEYYEGQTLKFFYDTPIINFY